jgi:hypothetical protein
MRNAEGSGVAGLAVSRSRRDGVTPLGDQLRAERERRGEVLEQVSEATKIRKPYLDALESHDWKALPADVFTRGYVRTYAQYLGLDQEHLLRAYARERRIAGVDDPPMSERAQQDAARVFLKKLAQARGVKIRRLGTRTKWIMLGLSGGGVAALAVGTFLHVLGPGWDAWTGIEAPSNAERDAVTARPEDNKSPRDLPVVVPTAKPRGQAEAWRSSHLKVEDFGVGTDVVDHRLVGRGDRFREGTVVWFWTSVLGGRPGDKIRHVWLHGDRTVAVTALSVNGAHWRTQSRRPLPEGSTGDWTVETRDPEGHLIASVGFTCVAAE